MNLNKTGARRGGHKRRINTEDNAKVVAAFWETLFIQLLAALAILHYRTILKNRMTCTMDDLMKRMKGTRQGITNLVTQALESHHVDDVVEGQLEAHVHHVVGVGH